MKILIAEDERAVRELALRILLGSYEITTAETVAEAKVFDKDCQYDLVITDNDCRRLDDGVVWARELCQDGRKVILMSGRPVADVPPGAKFLAKPFTPMELKTAVRELLGQNNSA